MSVYVITSNYFNDGLFGVCSTIKRARLVLENFFNENSNIVSFEDLGDYRYQFTTEKGETFGAEIYCSIVDFEFIYDIIEED